MAVFLDYFYLGRYLGTIRPWRACGCLLCTCGLSFFSLFFLVHSRCRYHKGGRKGQGLLFSFSFLSGKGMVMCHFIFPWSYTHTNLTTFWAAYSGVKSIDGGIQFSFFFCLGKHLHSICLLGFSANSIDMRVTDTMRGFILDHVRRLVCC